MEDNTQQPTPPEKPEIQDAQIVPESPKKKASMVRKSVLDQLPNEIKVEFNKIILHKSSKAAKQWMIENHSSDFPEAAKLSNPAYASYKKKNKARLLEEQELVLKVAATNPGLEKIVNSFNDPNLNLDDTKASLKIILAFLEDRKKLIALKQGQGFLDPFLEGLINQYTKTELAVIKEAGVIVDKVGKQAERNHAVEMESFFKVIISAVDNSYKMVNGKTNYERFCNQLDELLGPTLKNYRLVKDALVQADPK